MRGSILVVLAVLAGCNHNERGQPNWFGKEPDQLYGEGERTDYHLSFLLQMEYQKQWNQEVSMELDLASWPDDGMRKLVLARQERPVYSLFTYSQGPVFFPGKKWTVAVKAVVDRDEDGEWEAGETAARAAIERWKERYPELLAKYQWEEDPKILFRYADEPAGRFGFYRTLDGSMVFGEQGDLDPRGFHEAIETRYRWFEPEEPDEVENPNLYQGLRAALTAFDANPFPNGDRKKIDRAPSGGWKIETSHLVSSVAGAATTFTPVIRSQISGWADHQFEIPCRYEGMTDGRQKIVCEEDDFGESGDLGKGYRLESYRREILFHQDDDRFLLDSVAIVARHENGDTIRMVLTLRDPSIEEVAAR